MSETTTASAPTPAPDREGASPGRATGVLLVGAPLLLVAGTAITPAFGAAPSDYLGTFAAHPGRVQLGAVLFVLGHLLLAPALLALARSTSSRLARLAGAAAAFGATVFGGLGFLRLAEVAVAVTGGDPQPVEELGAMPGAVVLILPGVIGMTLGVLLLLVGLAREGDAPWWLLISFVAGQVGVLTGGDGTALGLAGSAMLALTFGALGRQVLRS